MIRSASGESGAAAATVSGGAQHRATVVRPKDDSSTLSDDTSALFGEPFTAAGGVVFRELGSSVSERERWIVAMSGQAHGIIFTADCAAPHNAASARRELMRIVRAMPNVPLLVLAVRAGSSGAASVSEMERHLDLHLLRHTCMMWTADVESGLRWLLRTARV